MTIILSFILTVMAGAVSNVISYYVCKWLDSREQRQQPEE